jgi:monofunctional glycosyltransferase
MNGKRSRAMSLSWANIRRWAWYLILLNVVLTAGVVLLFRFVNPPTTAFMVERQIDALDEKKFHLKHQWVPLRAVSRSAIVALLASEDQKFFHHFGFDVAAIEDAIDDRLEGKSRRGASTLSQQLAKNLFLWPGQSFVRKAFEVYFTLLIELFWPKARILEVYLNVAEFGDGVYGIEAAARINFSKSAASLGPNESALLAAVLPNPKVRRATAPTPKIQTKVDWIIAQARLLSDDVNESMQH